jgi:Protein of unknown function (DUF3617)
MRTAAILLLATLAAPAAGDELPDFRPGLWEFRRSVDGGDGKPASLTNQKCTNPTEDMKKKTESMAQAGCQPSPVTKSGNLYTFSLSCKIQGVEVSSRTLIKVENDSAYVVDAESKQDGNFTREHLVATRLGDCPSE